MSTHQKRGEARQKPYRYTACGLNNIYLEGGVSWKQTPRGKVVQIEDLEGLHRAIGKTLVDEKKTLNGKEFRFLRHEINLTQQKLASLLGEDVQSIGRWERGASKIPGSAQAVMRLLYREEVNKTNSIKAPLARLAELDEPGGDNKMHFTADDGGWSMAA